ncbi:hypothetical protein ACWF94_08455 [Streptomyces sp. NPDC055078]
MTTVVNGEVRRVCAVTATLPLRLLALVLEIAPGERPHPLEVVTGLRCAMEEHADGPHFDLVHELKDAGRGEVWVRWESGCEPECVAVLPDCPADNGKPDGENDACTLFSEHPGGHSFAFCDPEYDAILASPEYDRLRAEIDAHLRGTS